MPNAISFGGPSCAVTVPLITELHFRYPVVVPGASASVCFSPLDIYGRSGVSSTVRDDSGANMPAANNALQGTLDLLVLKTLAQLGSMHGFGIAFHIQQISKDVLRVEEGSLYPALRRIEKSGWIVSEWATTDNNRRAKYYRLTALGKRQLAHEEQNWAQLVSGVNAILRYA